MKKFSRCWKRKGGRTKMTTVRKGENLVKKKKCEQ